MKKIKIAILVLGSLLIGKANLYAADIEKVEGAASASPGVLPPEEPHDTAAEIDAIRNEIAILKYQYDRSISRTIANSNRSLLIGGTLQNRYSSTTYTSGSATPDADGFVFNSAILSLKGNLQKDYEEGKNVDYVIGLQAAATAYNFQPTDAYLQYSIFPSLDNQKPLLYVQFGQQKKPFGLEATTTEDKQPAINSAIFAGSKGLNLSQRDIGILVRGDLAPAVDIGYSYRIPLIEYSIGLFNGSGPNTLDTNRSKDVVARVVLNAPVEYDSDFRGLSFGSSYANGNQDLTLKNATVLPGQGSRIRYGQDISYVSSPIGFTAEYAIGQDEQALSGTNQATLIKNSIRSKGYTLTLFYEWGEQFLKNFRSQDRLDDWWPKTYQPFVRLDRWDPNTSVANNETQIITVGFNVFFAQTTKFQVNYSLTDNKATNIKQKDLNLQFQYGF